MRRPALFTRLPEPRRLLLAVLTAYCLVLVLLLWPTGVACAWAAGEAPGATSRGAARATVSFIDGPGGQHWVRLENAWLRLDFAPELGARAAVCIDKTTGHNLVPNPAAQRGGGLFLDHFWEQNWPGELLGATYSAVAGPAGPAGEASVIFAAGATGQWGGQLAPLLTGLQLTRTVTLAADAPVVQLAVKIYNPTESSKVAGYWMQNVLWAGGDKENDRYLRPNSRSVSRIGYDWKTKTPILGFLEDSFERAPTAGWTAVIDQAKSSGMAFVMDYGPLMNLYNSLPDGTVEWQYLQTAIPPGKTWETAITAIAMCGFSGLQYASPQLLLDTRFAVTPQGLQISLDAARGAVPVKTLHCELSLLGAQSRRRSALPAVDMHDLVFAAKTATVSVPGPFTEPVVLKVTATVDSGKGFGAEQHFEVWYGGSLGFAGVNRTIDLPPMYPLPAQPKAVTFLKPEKIELIRTKEKRVLVIDGYQSEAWHAADAAQAWGAQVRTSRFQQASSIAANVSYWPVEYSELMSYDAIVLANLDASALSAFEQEMVRDYVNAGGGLLVLGGMNTLGNGHFAAARFADVLPVQPGGAFEIVPLKQKAVTISPATPLAPLLNGMGGQAVNFVHRLVPRAGAQVAATAGGAPLLVTGTFGRGRVAVLGATTLGGAPPQQSLLWQGAAWPQTLANIIGWCTAR